MGDELFSKILSPSWSPCDFSVLELVRSQTTFSTVPEVLQNYAGFTLCSLAGLTVGDCSVVVDLTPSMHVVCTDLLCVVCIGLLAAEFLTVNTGLGRSMFWKSLRLLSTPEGLAATKFQLT